MRNNDHLLGVKSFKDILHFVDFLLTKAIWLYKCEKSRMEKLGRVSRGECILRLLLSDGLELSSQTGIHSPFRV